MALEEYARKRSFRKTPEPPPEPASTSGNSFCVQRHHARRLHYDFRVEVGGTLKSWAVPQGPSLDPAHKRLAVMVEDHPLGYGTFEGNIPAGNYGAGSVMLWDTGAWEPAADRTAEDMLARGDFKFRLRGRKLNGEFALVRMKPRGPGSRDKGNEWLLIKKRDAFASPGWDIENHARSALTGRTQEEIARDMPAHADASATIDPAGVAGAVAAPMPAAISPMLAEIADKPPSGEGWTFEIKWDGVRALCFLDESGLRLVTRNGNAMTRQYPELSVLPHYVGAKSAILDGEIAVLDEGGRPSFSRIQPRIMASDANAIAQLARSRPVTLFLFDLLYLDGYDLRGATLVERRRLLQAIARPAPNVRLSDQFQGNAAELHEAARAQGLEGLVAKRLESKYQARRSRDWLKIKITHDGDFVLCGYTEGERDYFGALALGVYDRGEMKFAGCVGTGFDNRQIEALYRLLEPLTNEVCPFAETPAIPQKVHWVRPEKVCTVKYHSWTEEQRLRAPVFVGLRPDKDPRECELHPAVASVAPPVDPARPPLFDGKRTETTLAIGGRRLAFRHLDKMYYPRDGYLKRDVLNYYDAVADLILPHLKDRPLSLRRYPDGIDQEGFFQKDASTGFPDWLRTASLVEAGEDKQYALCDDRAALIYITNLGCIDHNPWMSRVGTLENPDFILIDLDPQGCSYDRIVEAALVVRRKLDALGLAGYPKTTGGGGMHIYVPLEPVYSYEQARTFAEIVARLAASERPDLFTTPRPVARREKGRVYFDYLQVMRGKTISAPYVLRAHDRAPVATPLDWNELTPALRPEQFHIRNAVERFARVGDLFAGVLTNLQRLEPAMARLESLVRG